MAHVRCMIYNKATRAHEHACFSAPTPTLASTHPLTPQTHTDRHTLRLIAFPLQKRFRERA